MNVPLLIRACTDSDIDAIAPIYAHHVLHGTATFETEPPDATEMLRRKQELERLGYPYLVAEVGGRVAGYAYAGPYRPRPAYQHTVENSVYVDPACVGQGIGSELLPRLISACEDRGYRQMVAVIGGSDNAASIRLHERFGFRHVGVLKDVGFKFGRAVDTVLMQRQLNPASNTT